VKVQRGHFGLSEDWRGSRYGVLEGKKGPNFGPGKISNVPKIKRTDRNSSKKNGGGAFFVWRKIAVQGGNTGLWKRKKKKEKLVQRVGAPKAVEGTGFCGCQKSGKERSQGGLCEKRGIGEGGRKFWKKSAFNKTGGTVVATTSGAQKRMSRIVVVLVFGLLGDTFHFLKKTGGKTVVDTSPKGDRSQTPREAGVSQ